MKAQLVEELKRTENAYQDMVNYVESLIARNDKLDESLKNTRELYRIASSMSDAYLERCGMLEERVEQLEGNTRQAGQPVNVIVHCGGGPCVKNAKSSGPKSAA